MRLDWKPVANVGLGLSKKNVGLGRGGLSAKPNRWCAQPARIYNTASNPSCAFHSPLDSSSRRCPAPRCSCHSSVGGEQIWHRSIQFWWSRFGSKQRTAEPGRRRRQHRVGIWIRPQQQVCYPWPWAHWVTQPPRGHEARHFSVHVFMYQIFLSGYCLVCLPADPYNPVPTHVHGENDGRTHICSWWDEVRTRRCSSAVNDEVPQKIVFLLPVCCF